MKKKLIAVSTILIFGTVFGTLLGVAQSQSFASTTSSENVQIKYIDGWRAHETDIYKINKVDDAICVEGLNSDQNKFTSFLQFAKPNAEMKHFLISADIRSENLEGWAGLWMRIDGQNKKPLAFDNMENRPIKATQAWKSYNVVLDVSPKAQSIVFGFLLSGKGKAWVRNIQFKSVDMPVNSTNLLVNP